jgi:acetoacetate decarboxylase
VLAVYFRADEPKLRELLPRPLELDGGLVMAYIGQFHSASEQRPVDMLRNPDGAQYRETGLWIACSYRGRPGWFPGFVWVDKEWSLLRGWMNGYPKKLAEVVFARPHVLNPVTRRLGEGAVAAGICTRHGHTLVRLGLTVKRAAQKTELQSRPATYGHRHWPALHESQTVVSELVEVNRSDLVVSDVWAGEPYFELGTAPDEELEYFSPREILAGFTYSYGFRIAGAKVLEKLA